jgi:RNA polymerase sigma-70 factor (ECF subfamily)
MFAIVKDAWIDGPRGRRIAVREMVEAGVGVEGEAARHSLDAEAVADAVARLPEDQRIAVALVLVEGLSYREAGEILGVPAGVLTTRLAHGRRALLDRLAGGGVAA